jgi:antitoxin ParD1/3/4
LALVADENVDAPIVAPLRAAGHRIVYVRELDPGIDDDQVLDLANRNGALLLTSDKDFGDLVFRQGIVHSANNPGSLDYTAFSGYSLLQETNSKVPSMGTTSLSLGEHWEAFIKHEVSSGRCGSASEVVRDALRHMEEHRARPAALRGHLAEGEAEAMSGNFVPDYSIEAILTESERAA